MLDGYGRKRCLPSTFSLLGSLLCLMWMFPLRLKKGLLRESRYTLFCTMISFYAVLEAFLSNSQTVFRLLWFHHSLIIYAQLYLHVYIFGSCIGNASRTFVALYACLEYYSIEDVIEVLTRMVQDIFSDTDSYLKTISVSLIFLAKDLAVFRDLCKVSKRLKKNPAMGQV